MEFWRIESFSRVQFHIVLTNQLVKGKIQEKYSKEKNGRHMGDKLRTILNLEVIKSDLENNLLYLKGSIPGSKNSTVLLRESVKNISRKTIKEKYEAKIKAAAAKKGKK